MLGDCTRSFVVDLPVAGQLEVLEVVPFGVRGTSNEYAMLTPSMGACSTPLTIAASECRRSSSGGDVDHVQKLPANPPFVDAPRPVDNRPIAGASPM